jgi:toxin ParE1/3/4
MASYHFPFVLKSRGNCWRGREQGPEKLIIETCRKISAYPDIGKNYEDISIEILGFQVGKHIILYRLTKPKEIEVVRILHGRMDLKSRIGE